MKKNKAAQQLQKLSRLAQIKRLGSEGYKKDMAKRAKKRWDDLKAEKKLIN